MQRAAFTLTIVATIAVATAGLDAQGRGRAAGQSRPAPIRFAAMDQNHDRMIQRDEWQGSKQAFSNQDWNSDGILSGEEVRVGAQRSIRWEEADHEPNRAERNLSWSAAAFRNLDHNRDGRLAANEWHYDLETFHRVDRNRDQVISRAEFVGTNQDDGRDVSFDDLDADNNGRVERTEWYFSPAAFTSLDRNRDGILSRFEVVGSQSTTGDTYDQFASLDYDRNGTLSSREWHWSLGSFTQRDQDGNGLLTRREFDATTGSSAVTSTRSVTVNAQQRWTDGAIDVRAGDVITFDAGGTIVMSDNADDAATPAGSRNGRRAPDAPILNQLAGGLVARIGTYGPIWVGDRRTLTAPVSGRLFLGVNDDHLADNRGEFVVVVGVQNRATY